MMEDEVRCYETKLYRKNQTVKSVFHPSEEVPLSAVPVLSAIYDLLYLGNKALKFNICSA